MRIISLLLIFWVAFSLSISAQTKTSYVNKKYEYKIDFPAKWDIEELPSKEEPVTVVAKSPSTSSFLVNVKKDASFKGRNANQLSANDITAEIKEQFRKVILLESDYQTYEEMPLLYLKFSAETDDDDKIFILQYYLFRNEYLYLIQAMTLQSDFENEEGVINSAVYSFNYLGAQSEFTSNFYRSEQYEYSINFPDGWKKTLNGTQVGAVTSGGAVSMFIDVVVDREYAGMTMLDYPVESFTEAIQKQYEEGKIIESRRMPINGISAIFIKHKFKDKGTEVTMLHYFIVKDSKLFVIQCTSPTSSFSTHEGTFKTAVLSLRL